MAKTSLWSLLKSLSGKFSSRETPYQYQPLASNIEVVNFWPTQRSEDLWLYLFVTSRLGELIDADNTMLLASVFGPRHYISESPSKIKIFYTGENVDRFPKYKDHCLDIVDLSFGFEYLQAPNYMRLPLWPSFVFRANADQREIQTEMDRIMNAIRSTPPASEHFCSLISSHDKSGVRSKLMKSLSGIGHIDSAGKFKNNCNALKEKYNDSKIDFMHNYQFNICPENTNKDGYVTEKVFEAIKAGTIPIYWGSNGRPEPEVLKQEAILFYNGPGSVKGLQQEVARLRQHPKQYEEFRNQDRFQPHAAEYLAEMLHTAEMKIRKIIKEKNALSGKWN
ncbi:glycosyltransferase family 10 domain-containing protein [Chitinophaga arvensicola]|uniref:Glycosyltransferase family 10 (Fucosyltransferase) C-term n=1 Tax=Chitinophaga arvensicola TaxID=29529 RepID=A0A1I0RR58_9BACT|nr:glycosyltransferase family 10 [Chitinophaga arvensicola]SEW43737.1 Glycosyltransferase family 10 (fucosyltransferase) C-term [Chitinophaga arvensicola]